MVYLPTFGIIWLIFMVDESKYTIYMNPMGKLGCGFNV